LQAEEKVAIVGLGYVGLPLAVAFGRQVGTIGFDLNEKKLAAYRDGTDPSGEVSDDALAAARWLEYTSDPAALGEADYVIVVVPTPIDQARHPDLSPLQRATATVGRHLRPGATVIFESTVYPGCTEEVCVPILERESGLAWSGRDGSDPGAPGFSVGYSPERINPGDKEHRLETIVKVVSGDSPATLERVAGLYARIIDAGVHRAGSIKVAEAAKVIENTQRDLNIALMNELAMIFDRLGIDTLDVLEAAGTKWNFLPFRPGLVGGHCIGVDPYYLTYKAESVGYHPQVVLGGRRVNDGMARYIAEQTVKTLSRGGCALADMRVTVLGLTFKENCPDLRNSRVADVIRELEEYGCSVAVHDPIASADEAELEYGVSLRSLESLEPADALVFAVPHREFLASSAQLLERLLRPGGLAVDVKGVLDRDATRDAGYQLWRL
jgi:UDP-N-acetyl-D-galactosamine dehydrogenase